jgi:SAM-dependent methyltransferase
MMSSQEPTVSAPIELEFSQKYTKSHSEQYFKKHQDGIARRLSHWRDNQLARRALVQAGHPRVVLDIPSGAGRFWPLLAEDASREIYAADNSAHMLDVAKVSQPPAVVSRVKAFQTSAFDIKLQDNAVDSIFSMRLMHHIAQPEHRLAMLKEFHRVTRDTVILSLWVDGNFKAWKRKRLEAKRPAAVNNNRFVIPQATIEAEFLKAGFEIVGHQDFIPKYAMWRVYVLRKIK